MVDATLPLIGTAVIGTPFLLGLGSDSYPILEKVNMTVLSLSSVGGLLLLGQALFFMNRADGWDGLAAVASGLFGGGLLLGTAAGYGTYKLGKYLAH